MSAPPLLRAAAAGDAAAVEAALDGGADVNCRDKRERTALHVAAAGGHVNAVILLLEREADVDAEDEVRLFADL
jgi:uncharacterized protein